MVSCPTCNTENEAGAIYCDQCGADLTAAGGLSLPAAPVAATPAGGGGVCPACGAAAISGDAFCNECGAALAAAPQAYSAPVAPNAPVATAPTPPAHAESAQIITSNGQSVPLAGKPSYLIGREDQVSGIYPEIDTTRSDGDSAGVSRRHAEIVRRNNQWFLQDLNSTNGTFVNNLRLPPHTSHPLHSGDQIRLGKWVATFQVKQGL